MVVDFIYLLIIKIINPLDINIILVYYVVRVTLLKFKKKKMIFILVGDRHAKQ